MFNEEVSIKHGLSYISFCPLWILYNSKFIITATCLGTNAVVVTRVQCISLPENESHTKRASAPYYIFVHVGISNTEYTSE